MSVNFTAGRNDTLKNATYIHVTIHSCALNLPPLELRKSMEEVLFNRDNVRKDDLHASSVAFGGERVTYPQVSRRYYIQPKLDEHPKALLPRRLNATRGVIMTAEEAMYQRQRLTYILQCLFGYLLMIMVPLYMQFAYEAAGSTRPLIMEIMFDFSFYIWFFSFSFSDEYYADPEDDSFKAFCRRQRIQESWIGFFIPAAFRN